ncbi:MAG: hypothetical protein J7L45_03525 [Candidatus Aenigmarchaeota archaeon]|nr:hypothetical protein [Candidatus Aenigmarchaeota archaeon]
MILLDLYLLEEVNTLDKYSREPLIEFLKRSPDKDFVVGNEREVYVTKVGNKIDVFEESMLLESIEDMKIYSMKKIGTRRITPEYSMKSELPSISRRVREDDEDLLIRYEIPETVIYRSNHTGEFGPKKGIRARV